MLKRSLVGVLLAWYVVTYNGQIVAGPFAVQTECTKMAQQMAREYLGVNPSCAWK